MRNTITKQTVELGKKYDLSLDGNITENFKAIASAETGVTIEGNNLTEVVTNFVENFTPGQGGGEQTPVKGGYVLIDGHKYLVLDANEDLTQVKLMFADLNGSKYWDVAGSPSSDEKVTFHTESEDVLGLKYAGSNLDTYCNETFLATLPQEVQDAIIEQNVVQDMYSFAMGDAEEGDTFATSADGWGGSYRNNKVNTESVTVGSRKIRSLMMSDIINYLGSRTTNTALNSMIFGFGQSLNVYAWLADAYSDSSNRACNVIGDYGSVSNFVWSYNSVVRPTFLINWNLI